MDEEFRRLRQWIAREVLPSRPAIITDPLYAQQLRKIDAYGPWENLDEISEYQRDAHLTFVLWGDNSKDFTAAKGVLHCVRNGSGRLFAMPNQAVTNVDIPYVIVDERPEKWDIMNLVEQYHWDDEECERLLPGFGLKKLKLQTSSNKDLSFYDRKFTLEEGLKILDDACAKLMIEEPYRELIESAIEDEKNTIEKNGGRYWNTDSWHRPMVIGKDWDEMTEEEQEWQLESEREAYEIDQSQLREGRCHVFALGVRIEEKITWIAYATNLAAIEYNDLATYELGFTKRTVRSVNCVGSDRTIACHIDAEHYLGRGSFAPSLKDKRVALLGCGAIGSMLAESLVRSGVKKLGLWDKDIIEPGNLCRSIYRLGDLGDSKAEALKKHLQGISPSCNVWTYSVWQDDPDYEWPMGCSGNFYDSINYQSQADTLKLLDSFDLIIDCTASNELLHFLSYAVKDKPLYSLCITNRSNNLLLLSNADGNVFNLRKYYLSKIEQDTQNYYHEGSGCYSATFLATHSDINALVALAAREMNQSTEAGHPLHSVIWSYDRRGIVADRLRTYACDHYDIRLTIPSETLFDAEDLSDVTEGPIGYMLGGYNREGSHILLTHFVPAETALEDLKRAYQNSEGLIDYIGDFCYTMGDGSGVDDEVVETLAAKAADPTINTRNPILALRGTDGSLAFYLYINGVLEPFHEVTD